MKPISTIVPKGALGALFLLLLSMTCRAGCVDPTQLKGVNLAGAEFNAGALPGRVNFDYTYPARTDLEYFHSAGMNVIRLPFLWERLQPRLDQALDPGELAQIRQVGSWASELGLCVILDVHNYGEYRGQPIGSSSVPVSSFADLWVRIHKEFPQPDLYAYGLMNEPAALAVKAWTPIAQSAVLAIRAAGSRNLLLVGTGRWSGAHELLSELDGTTADKEFSGFQDPLNRTTIELHQYADSDYSGRGRDCMDPARLRQILDRASAWSRKSGRKVFLGEFGVSVDPPCLNALEEALKVMQEGAVWTGWTYWSAGRWWGDYPYSVQPTPNGDAAQFTILRRYARRPLAPTGLKIDPPGH